MRQELRDQKRQRYLDAAITIVMRDGFDGLTMGAIAREVTAAVGTIYGYFSSKGSLVSELQVFAIETLVAAWREAVAIWSAEFVRSGMSNDERILAELLTYGEYFTGIRRAYPEEFQLQQLQLARRQPLFGEDELARLIPAGEELLGCAYDLVKDAADAEVISEPHSARDRSLGLVLALNGIAMMENVPYVDDSVVLDRISRRVSMDLVASWGAEHSQIDRLMPVVTAVVESLPLESLPSYTSHQSRLAASRSDGVIDLSDTPVDLISLPTT